MHTNNDMPIFVGMSTGVNIYIYFNNRKCTVTNYTFIFKILPVVTFSGTHKLCSDTNNCRNSNHKNCNNNEKNMRKNQHEANKLGVKTFACTIYLKENLSFSRIDP